MTRREARELAFKTVFEHSIRRDVSYGALYDGAVAYRDEEEDAYVRKIVTLLDEQETAVNAMIVKYAKGWSIERISGVSLAIMQVACCEMMFCEEIPVRVSLNEAVELAKTYDEERARAFVNGILNSVAKEINRPEA